MGAIQIIFVVINLAIPYWIWTKNSDDSLPKVEWHEWEKNLGSLVDAQGGFPSCSRGDVVSALRYLCQNSRNQWKEKETTTVERTGIDMLFTCEVRKDSVVVSWRPERTQESDLKCKVPRQTAGLNSAPSFHFGLKGHLHWIEFSSQEGSRQYISVSSCRKKLRKAESFRPRPEDPEEFVSALGVQTGDPSDHLTGNRLCLVYGISRRWSQWRKRLLR